MLLTSSALKPAPRATCSDQIFPLLAGLRKRGGSHFRVVVTQINPPAINNATMTVRNLMQPTSVAPDTHLLSDEWCLVLFRTYPPRNPPAAVSPRAASAAPGALQLLPTKHGRDAWRAQSVARA